MQTSGEAVHLHVDVTCQIHDFASVVDLASYLNVLILVGQLA